MVSVGFTRISPDLYDTDMFCTVLLFDQCDIIGQPLREIIIDCNNLLNKLPTIFYIDEVVISHFETILLHIAACQLAPEEL